MIRVPSVNIELDDPVLEAHLFAEKKKEELSTGKKVARYGGAALTAAGILGAIKGRPWLRMTARHLTKKKRDYGKDLSDYIEGSQTATNEGVIGRLYGGHLARKAKKLSSRKHEQKLVAKKTRAGTPARQARKEVGDKLGGERFANDHYRRFRSGHREALKHYDWESGLHLAHRRKEKGQAGRWIHKENRAEKLAGKLPQQWLAKGRKKLHGDKGLIQAHLNSGLNEKEAIRKALTSQDPDIKKYAQYMVKAKSGADKGNVPVLKSIAGENAFKKYKIIANAAGPGLIAAGGLTTGASYIKGKKSKKSKKP
jgi:hypothetical protein